MDDLGAEPRTPFYESAVYNLINSRMNMGLPTIVSSNYSVEELYDHYNERIISRLFGFYEVLIFVGKDIRQLKRLEK
ncbi:dNA replication protein [Ruminococcus sp. CAG:353]|jgi:DNA replication protein DnaC|nr:dNA replication protein [Ruminococcus sp. CAG:353]